MGRLGLEVAPRQRFQGAYEGEYGVHLGDRDVERPRDLFEPAALQRVQVVFDHRRGVRGRRFVVPNLDDERLTVVGDAGADGVEPLHQPLRPVERARVGVRERRGERLAEESIVVQIADQELGGARHLRVGRLQEHLPQQVFLQRFRALQRALQEALPGVRIRAGAQVPVARIGGDARIG